MTDSKASMLMRWKIASRRMPALLTTPSSLPKLSIALLTILLAGIASATVSKFATAVPPRFLISATTSSAGEALDPEPSAATPGSLTTTLPPSAAQSSAISRPMPRPAPVTMTDLPSSDLPCAIGVSRCCHSGAREARTRNLEIPGLFMRHEAEIAEAIQRQMRERIVDHQVIDILVGDAGFLEGQGAGDLEGARTVKGLHLADHRRLNAFAGAEDVDRLFRKIPGAVGRGQDQRAAAIGDEAALQDAEWIGDHPRVQDIRDRDRRLHGGARVLRRPFALHHRDHGDLLMGDAMGLHVAQYGNRKHAGRRRNAVRQLELAVEAVGADHPRGAADIRLAALGVGNQHGLAQPGLDRRGSVADVQHERTAPDGSAVDPGWRDSKIVRNLLRRLDRRCKTIDVGQF